MSLEVLESRHREILVHLEKLTELVGNLQSASPDDKVRCCAHEVIEFFSAPSRDHDYDEEQRAMVRLLQSDEQKVRAAAERLREDHAWIELHWLDIESQLLPLAEGEPSIDQAALQAATAMFAALTNDHIFRAQSLLSRLSPA
jgi:hypothetical protein